jgi:hypothetical protein
MSLKHQGKCAFSIASVQNIQLRFRQEQTKSCLMRLKTRLRLFEAIIPGEFSQKTISFGRMFPFCETRNGERCKDTTKEREDVQNNSNCGRHWLVLDSCDRTGELHRFMGPQYQCRHKHHRLRRRCFRRGDQLPHSGPPGSGRCRRLHAGQRGRLGPRPEGGPVAS